MDAFNNHAIGTLASGISSAATSLSVGSGEGARFPAVPFNATIWNATDYTNVSDARWAGAAEIVRVTAISTDALTIVRAQEGTTARNFNTGGKIYRIQQGITAKTMNQDVMANGSSGLFPVLAAAAQNFVYEGDSHTADAVGSYPRLLNALPWAVGHQTYSNFATPGNALSNVTGRYTANVFPLRPTGGITSSFLFVWIGTVDLLSAPSSSAWLTPWDAYITQARADGFKVVAFTIMKYVDGSTEALRQQINAGIRKDPNWDVLIDVDQLFPDNTDTTFFNVDQIHLNAAGKVRLAAYVNAKMTAADVIPLPPTAITTGTLDAFVPTNAILKSTARSYTGAQGFAQTLLADAAPVVWSPVAAQTARLVIGGNRTIANPTGAIPAGFRYTLIITQDATGSRTATWGSKYKWPGGTAPTLTATAARSDVFEFISDGTNLLGSVIGQNYDSTVPIAYAVQEQATPVGSDQGMGGTPPDTLNVPGGNWTVSSGTATRINSTGRMTLNNSYVSVETGLANGTFEVRNFNTGFSGITFRGTDANNYLQFLVNGTSTFLFKREAGSDGSVASGSSVSVDTTLGNVMKVVTSGSTINCYWDGVLVLTVSNSFNATATRAGMVSFATAAVLDDFTAI